MIAKGCRFCGAEATHRFGRIEYRCGSYWDEQSPLCSRIALLEKSLCDVTDAYDYYANHAAKLEIRIDTLESALKGLIPYAKGSQYDTIRGDTIPYTDPNVAEAVRIAREALKS